nr:MAG TPA: hypothetical protein [Caudoviricetes sp.]
MCYRKSFLSFTSRDFSHFESMDNSHYLLVNSNLGQHISSTLD